MYRIAIWSLLGSVALFGSAACKAKTPAAVPSNDPAIVATVNGTQITREQLQDAAEGQLSQVESQIYQIKKNALDDLVEEQLIAAGAKKAGLSVEAFLKKEVDDKATKPTEQEMKQFYEQRKAQIGDRSFDEVKGQIEQVLSQSRAQTARQALLASLKSGAEIAVNLEPPRRTIEAGDNPTKGPKDAPIQIVEWTDYQCPFCGRSRPTLNQIFATYGEKVRYTIRDFPLNFHKNAFKAHEAAHCANDQDKYWEYNTLLFEHQQALEMAQLKSYARQLKLDTAAFDKCLESGKHTAKVQKNLDAGIAAGVNGTPAFFVNGIGLSGARPFEDFKGIIEGELAKR